MSALYAVIRLATCKISTFLSLSAIFFFITYCSCANHERWCIISDIYLVYYAHSPKRKIENIWWNPWKCWSFSYHQNYYIQNITAKEQIQQQQQQKRSYILFCAILFTLDTIKLWCESKNEFLPDGRSLGSYIKGVTMTMLASVFDEKDWQNH